MAKKPAPAKPERKIRPISPMLAKRYRREIERLYNSGDMNLYTSEWYDASMERIDQAVVLWGLGE